MSSLQLVDSVALPVPPTPPRTSICGSVGGIDGGGIVLYASLY